MATPNGGRNKVEQPRDATRADRGRWPVAGRALLLVVVVVRSGVGDPLLELLLRLTERTGELRELGAAEQQKDDHEDEDQLGRTKVHGTKGSGSSWANIGAVMTAR
jgi:hypothetical protein